MAARLEDFVRRTGISFEQLLELSSCELISTSLRLKVGLSFIQMIHQVMSADYALACFATAQRFAR
jgi:hypothetical protein